jgi:arylsulfatase A-like enzyme
MSHGTRSRSGARALAAALLAGAAALLACGGAGRGPLGASSLVLVVADTLRADHLGCYGHPRPTSPFLDALAERSVLFEDVTSASSHTVPAVLSLLSGLHPHRHGNQYFPETNSLRAPRRRVRPLVPRGIPLLAEELRAGHFATAAVVANPWLRPEYGFARGFDDYRFLHGPEWTAHPSGEEVNAAAGELLERTRARRFFLYLHYMEPHTPYDPPPGPRALFAGGLEGRYVYRAGPAPEVSPEDLRFTHALYEGEVRALDDRLRELVARIEALGLAGSTLLALAGDHGEEFHEHRGLGHGRTLYEEVTRVPLLLFHPALPGTPSRIRAPAAGVDLAPTLLELMGLPLPRGIDGRSLAPFVLGAAAGEPPADRSILSELGTQAALRRGAHKLIRWRAPGGREDAFDLGRDPAEARPLPEPEGAAWRGPLSAELAGWLRAAAEAEAVAGAAQPAPPDPELERRLRALGYAEAPAGEPGEP